MDKMLATPTDRPHMRPLLLCIVMGVTTLALLPVIAPHGHHDQTRAVAAPVGQG